MKARFTFILLSIAIIGLLGACAWFTLKILDHDGANSAAVPVKPTAPEDVSITHEETMTLPDADPETRPTAREPKPVRPAAKPVKKAPPTADTSKPIPDFAGTVGQLAGDAHRTASTGSRMRLATKDKIHMGDTIETGTDSRMTIVFIDGTQLSLGEKTSCVIDEYAFDPSGKKEAGFGMRMVKGVCRVVTGMITTLNPDRFRVETRMATIGIRGCELGFQAQPEEEKVFILGLSKKESVVVASTDDGSAVRDILTGMDDDKIQTSSVVVNDPGTVVVVSKGLGRSVRAATPNELRDLTTGTTPLAAAKHSTRLQPNSTVFVISPKKEDNGVKDQ